MTQKLKQRGATLLVALIMLVALTLLVVSAIRSSTTNLRIAGNMQMQAEASASAQQAIEQLISRNFALNPVSAVTNVDTNNSGTFAYKASVAIPVCTGSVPIMNINLDMTNPYESTCLNNAGSLNTGIMYISGVPVTSGQSLCLTQQWDVQAEATSIAGNGADVTVHQGVSLRVQVGTKC